MFAEADSRLDIANQRIDAGRYCMERQRERLANGQIVIIPGEKTDLFPGLLAKGK